jgi:hypothetical protein
MFTFAFQVAHSLVRLFYQNACRDVHGTNVACCRYQPMSGLALAARNGSPSMKTSSHAHMPDMGVVKEKCSASGSTTAVKEISAPTGLGKLETQRILLGMTLPPDYTLCGKGCVRTSLYRLSRVSSVVVVMEEDASRNG